MLLTALLVCTLLLAAPGQTGARGRGSLSGVGFAGQRYRSQRSRCNRLCSISPTPPSSCRCRQVTTTCTGMTCPAGTFCRARTSGQYSTPYCESVTNGRSSYSSRSSPLSRSQIARLMSAGVSSKDIVGILRTRSRSSNRRRTYNQNPAGTVLNGLDTQRTQGGYGQLRNDYGELGSQAGYGGLANRASFGQLRNDAGSPGFGDLGSQASLGQRGNQAAFGNRDVVLSLGQSQPAV